MDNPEKNKTSGTTDELELDKGGKRPKFWGFVYLMLGIGGLAACLYTGYYDLYNIVPLFGTVIAGVLIAAISILIIIYGYRMMRRDL